MAQLLPPSSPREGAQTMIVYSKIFILVQAAFFRGNSMIQLNYKKRTKEDWYFDKTSKRFGNYSK